MQQWKISSLKRKYKKGAIAQGAQEPFKEGKVFPENQPGKELKKTRGLRRKIFKIRGCAVAPMRGELGKTCPGAALIKG